MLHSIKMHLTLLDGGSHHRNHLGRAAIMIVESKQLAVIVAVVTGTSIGRLVGSTTIRPGSCQGSRSSKCHAYHK